MNKFRKCAASLQGPSRPPKAFTLVELLVVMAVMMLILGLSASMFRSLEGSRGVTSAADQVRGVIELARAQAQGTGTWQWVGVKPAEHKTDLLVRLYRVPAGLDTIPITAQRDGKEFSFQSIKLSEVIPAAKVPRKVTDQKLPEKGGWLAVAPSGEVRLDLVTPIWTGTASTLNITAPSMNLHPWLEIGIIPSFGTGNSAVVQVAGLTGQLKVYRP